RRKALHEAGLARKRVLERLLIAADPHVDRSEGKDLRAERLEERAAAPGLRECAEGVPVAAHPLAVRGRANGAVHELRADQADRDERLDDPQRGGRGLAGADAERDVVGEDRRGGRAEYAKRAAPEGRAGDGEA